MTAEFFRSKRFITLMACLSGLTAMGIDTVLPTFPEMIDYFSLPEGEHNRIQEVVFVYMLGFASLQLVFGILADIMGRKLLLMLGIGVYVLAALSILFMRDFDYVLLARFIQGAGLAAPRVLSITIIRDVTSGREMSRIISFITMAFLAIPAIAPAIGQLMIMFLPWQSIFILLAILGFVVLLWVQRDLPETLPVSERRPLKFDQLKQACSLFLTDKTTLLYLGMISLLFGTLITYIGQAEQILQKDIYKLGGWFPFYFALIVLGMVTASVLNAKFVMRVGMHKIVFIALCLLLVVESIMLISVVIGGGVIPLWLFIICMILHFLGFGLMMPNINTLILEPYAYIAGTASALTGTITTTLGVLIAQGISWFFDSTLYSIGIGYLICGVALWLLNTAVNHTKSQQ
ncbi:MAG: multidrug effflux MFS transporter [Ostreibacterium sp.]